jgi:hypothetical protein
MAIKNEIVDELLKGADPKRCFRRARGGRSMAEPEGRLPRAGCPGRRHRPDRVRGRSMGPQIPGDHDDLAAQLGAGHFVSSRTRWRCAG